MKIYLFIIHAVAKNSKTGYYVSCMIEHKTYMDWNSLKLNHACTKDVNVYESWQTLIDRFDKNIFLRI